ncbi:MAG: PSD1 and planctomycete cytochrome C domain-containing protein [Pirellulales bacterium]
MKDRLTWFLTLLVFALLAMTAAPVQSADPIDFNRDIRPILSDKCFKCHGFDDATREAGLRLDKREVAIAPLESGSVAIVPGKATESELVVRVTSKDADVKMPPPDSGKRLTDDEIAKLTRWVAEGAEYQRHWSFIPPTRPALPEVKHQNWVRTPIDQFTLARLEKENLLPSLEANRRDLLRRVTFDLTGLPPALAEVDAFLLDNSPDAYEKVVDRLLASPRFGEHKARYWLDAARYADTHGLHFDNERYVWLYRDYVVNALNANKPFDQFTLEQTAGDLLPNATLEQKIATGFGRCNVSTNEGGSIDDEVLMRYGVDRVETMSTVFLGLTTGCAVCHDHKFDPITQKEFYELFAFYSWSADRAMDGNIQLPPPIVKAATPEQQGQLADFDRRIAQIQKQITDELAKIDYVEPAESQATTSFTDPTEYVWIDDDTPAGAKQQGNSPWEFISKSKLAPYSGQRASTRTADGVSQHFFTEAQPPLRVGEGDKLFTYVYLDPSNPPKTIMLQWNDGTWEHRAFWGDDLIPFGSGPQSPNHLHLGPLPKAGEWVRLEVEAQRVGLAPGAAINGWAFTQYDGRTYWDKAGIVTRMPQAGTGFDSLAKWEAYERSLKKSGLSEPVKKAVKIDPDKRNDEQEKQIRDYFLQKIYPKTRPAFEASEKQLEDLNKQKRDLDAKIPASLVMEDLDKPRDTFVLIRGQYDKKGEKVEPGIPAALGELPEGAPKNRLGLARWLTSRENPLTARVTVNRVWQQYFGMGLVKTTEDFGAQGQLPTHPDLFDWLAVDFVESGWDVKRLHKQIVMSATYRQSSQVTPELLARDPDNELYTRGPRFRIDAEMVRDQALFVSGLLAEQLGGRPVRPYQPPGIWEAVAFKGSNTEFFKPDVGEGLYRRSLYSFWKRTAPPPSMVTFDAPDREACVVQRARTNTPLQALVLMNDTQFVESARFLAERVIREGGATPEDRLTYAFRLATARRPAANELAVISRVFQSHLDEYKSNADAAKKLLDVGAKKSDLTKFDASELAAYTMATNLILNLDETITKE